MNNRPFVSELRVSLKFDETTIPVGRLAKRNGTIYFEYDAGFTKSGLNISPIHLPLQTGVTAFDRTLFDGLSGVFNDSLPDGWGRLLFDRHMRSQGVLPEQMSPLDRLAHIGSQGLGALIYEPELFQDEQQTSFDLDRFAQQSQEVLEGGAEEVISNLLTLNGSSAGARPKALIGLDETRMQIIHGVDEIPDGFEHWLVKFANGQDGIDAGAIEYAYALMAKEAGIDMPDVHLFPAQQGAGYFAIKRFDCINQQRLHMHTAGGLLQSDFRVPALDYEDLIALTGILTKDIREIEKMYRLAVFNTLAHNRDDHAKNFTYLMNSKGGWTLSPAYDLTFSSGPRGEQSTMVMGEGRAPNIQHLIKLGHEARISGGKVKEIIDQTQSALSKWESLAKLYGVKTTNIKLISNNITRNKN